MYRIIYSSTFLGLFYQLLKESKEYKEYIKIMRKHVQANTRFVVFKETQTTFSFVLISFDRNYS